MQLTIRYVKVGHNKFFGDFKHQVEEIPNEKTISDLAYEDLKIQHCCGLKPFYTSYDASLNKGEVYTINEKRKSKSHQVIGHFIVLKNGGDNK